MSMCDCNQGRLPCTCKPTAATEPIGCALCGGNDHNADECKRFAGERERIFGKMNDWQKYKVEPMQVNP